MAGPAELTVRIRRLAHGKGLRLPDRVSPGSAGLDLRAAVSEDTMLGSGERRLIPTGIALEIPSGWEGQVRPRSGLALRHGVTVLNSPGTIDSDYRGEVGVILVNLGERPFRLERGDRIAQLVLAPVAEARWREVAELEGTRRGEEGFGSSGSS